MRAYELMVIFDGDLDESTVQGVINRIHAQVTEADGHHGHHRQVGPPPLRLRDRPQERGLLRGVRDPGRAGCARPGSRTRCGSRTRSSATSSSACPTTRPPGAASLGEQAASAPAEA